MDYFHTEINGEKYYGKHMLVSAKSCMRVKVQDIELWKRFFTELVQDIDMIAFGGPQVYRFGEGIDEGVSGIQFITTSLLSVHTNDASGDIYLDVFSCKNFDEQVVLKKIDKFFEPLCINHDIILRK
jgi:S-adenosylmethionine/arginine decarboxylase-like enzyme